MPSLAWLILPPLFLLLRRKSVAYLLAAVSLGVIIGLWRGGQFMQNVYKISDLSGQKVAVEAVAKTDAVYSKYSQIEFTAAQIHVTQPADERLAGSAKVSGFGVPMVYRGDKVQIYGKLYPMRGSNQVRISYAQISRLGESQSAISDLTRKFDAGMQTALPEPQASFGLGLLIGQRTTLSQEVTDALTAVGLVHIVAVSGYNLTIIVRGVSRLKLGSKYQKLLFSLTLIAAFVLVTGFSASIVRAALVSILSLWAWYYGRRIKPLVSISLAAAITGFWSPFYIWSDLGWYLSFLAFFGVLVIAPLIAARFFKQTPKLLTMVLLETLSAELMTLPLILMTFSQLSVVALLANVLVVPLVPLAMLLSAAAGLAGMIAPALAGWIALPARLLLTYMLDLVHMLSDIPSVLIHRSISAVYMFGLYSAVIAVTLVLYRKLPKRSGDLAEERP